MTIILYKTNGEEKYSFPLLSTHIPYLQYWKHLFSDIMIIIQASFPLLYDVPLNKAISHFPPLSHTQYKHMKTLVQEHVYMCHRGKQKKKNRGRKNYSAKKCMSDSGCGCLKSIYIVATSKSIVLILYLTSCYKKH